MKFFTFWMLIIFALSSNTILYSQSEFKECILGVRQSPILLGVPEKSIEKFCDCALSSNPNKNDQIAYSSINKCASKNFS